MELQWNIVQYDSFMWNENSATILTIKIGKCKNEVLKDIIKRYNKKKTRYQIRHESEENWIDEEIG